MAGYAENDTGNDRATVWSGNSWSTKTDLGTLRSDNSGGSAAYAISSDGAVVAGYALNDTGDNHATVWSGNNWSTKTDLGTLRSDNSGNSGASAISSDGSVVAGYSDTDSGNRHAAIWKVIYSVVPAMDPVTDPAPKVFLVDVTNTKRTVAELSAGTFQVMDLQRQALLRLHNGCDADWNEACWFARAGQTSTGGHSDTPGSLTMGYGVEKNLSIGATLDHSLTRSLPDGYQDNSSNIGVGIHAYWHLPDDTGEWYLRPSLAFNQYHVDIRRPELSHTEPGKGGGRMKGEAAALEGGRKMSLKNGIALQFYTGVRYDNVTQNGYTESDAIFPVTYDDVKYRSTTVFAGLNTSVPVSQQVHWVSDAEIEQQVGGDSPTVTAHQQYMGSMVHTADMTKTRGELLSGIHYTTTNNVTVEVMPSVGVSALGDIAWGVNLGVGGRF